MRLELLGARGYLLLLNRDGFPESLRHIDGYLTGKIGEVEAARVVVKATAHLSGAPLDYLRDALRLVEA